MRAFDELRLFDHLAQTRHFGRTSAECHVTQPTLSRTIARMESELGVRLFDRDRRGVALTADGIRFHSFAQTVLAAWFDYDHAQNPTELRGSVSVFCTVTASQSILPDILTRFRVAHPSVHLDLETGYAAEALQKLDEGAVDVTVAALPARAPRHLATHVITTTPIVLVAPVDGSLSLPPEPNAEWSQVPFVLPASGLVRSLIDRWFRRLRVRPTVAAEAAGHEAVLALVSLGCGIGVVPELVATSSPLAGRLRIVTTSVPKATFDIAACTTPERLAQPNVAALWKTMTSEPNDRGGDQSPTR